jgi:hypothetical protein
MKVKYVRKSKLEKTATRRFPQFIYISCMNLWRRNSKSRIKRPVRIVKAHFAFNKLIFFASLREGQPHPTPSAFAQAALRWSVVSVFVVRFIRFIRFITDFDCVFNFQGKAGPMSIVLSVRKIVPAKGSGGRYDCVKNINKEINHGKTRC